LEDYIEGGIEDVSIYGNHASIMLKDNKKEFKISEFLNSDFCQENGISGFSTLHNDGKSGMHGFVAKEGDRKIRHYVVTDGSYEMTLNWYVNGEKCTIIININADGSVERIGGHDVNEKQLRGNKDVKICNLYLYEVLAKGRWKEVNEPSFEAVIRKDVEKPAQKNKAANTIREAGSQTPPPPPPRISSPKKNVFNEQGGLDHQDDRQKPTFTRFEHTVSRSQKPDGNEQTPKVPITNPADQTMDELKEVLKKSDKGLTKPAQQVIEKNTPKDPFSENILQEIKGDKSIYKWLKDKIEGKENNQNLDAPEKNPLQRSGQDNIVEKRESDDGKPPHSETHTVPSKPVSKESKSTQSTNPADQVMDELEEVLKKSDKRLTKPAQQVIEKNIPRDHSSENVLEKIEEGKRYDPIRNWLKNKIEGRKNNKNLDALEKKLSPKYSQGNIVKKRENDSDRLSSPVSTDNKNIKQLDEKMPENIKKFRANPYGCTNSRSNSSSPSPIHANHDESQTNSKQLKANLMNVEQSDDTQQQKNSRRIDKEPEEEERNFQKTKEALKEWKENRRNVRQSNSSSSSPIHDSHNESQVNPEQLKASLTSVEQAVTPENSNNEFKETLSEGPRTEERIEVSSNKVCNEPIDEKLKSIQPIDQVDQVINESREALEKSGKGLKRSAQQVIEKNIPKDLFSENVLEKIEKGNQYDPIRNWLKDKIEDRKNNQDLSVPEENPSQKSGQDNIITATTKLSAALSELCIEAQKGFAKRRRINQPRVEQVARQQQGKDIKGI